MLWESSTPFKAFNVSKAPAKAERCRRGLPRIGPRSVGRYVKQNDKKKNRGPSEAPGTALGLTEDLFGFHENLNDEEREKCAARELSWTSADQGEGRSMLIGVLDARLDAGLCTLGCSAECHVGCWLVHA